MDTGKRGATEVDFLTVSGFIALTVGHALCRSRHYIQYMVLKSLADANPFAIQSRFSYQYTAMSSFIFKPLFSCA
jgi:hypothetical protein